MGNFRKGGNSYGGGFGGRGRSFGNRSGRGPVVMHQATCDQCGNSCEVPFKPSNDKPVYCNDCFGGKRENKGRDRFPQKNYDNYKTPARPDFKGDFGKGDGNGLKKQLEILNANMNRLIGAIEAIASAKSPAAELPVKAKKLVKKVSKKQDK